HEAAQLDGANGWQRFWNITLPDLAPVFLFISVTTVINYFQLFAEPYVMTQGGPLKSTTSLVLLMYEQGFRWWRLGYAAALAFVLFALILLATTVQMRLQAMQAAKERA
ncbi:MAG: sugar ABC transporter permease, partial [Candidatus Eisenbacteria bacterium]|nr:sugar ABC transporter permease [Candidatus Eisenbacteria bacterium]